MAREAKALASGRSNPWDGQWSQALGEVMTEIPVAQRGTVEQAVADLHGRPWDTKWREWCEMVGAVIRKVSEDHRAIVFQAFVDLQHHNLLQPGQGQTMAKGVQAKRRQWNRIAGGQAGNANLIWIVLGSAGGAVIGGIFGLAVPPVTDLVPMPILLGLIGVPLGAVLGYLPSVTGDGFQDGMMLVIANERRSIIRPEMVTGQVEAWIPKALLSWRSHDWRYRDGRPYLWVQLPGGKRIKEELSSTLDYLCLPNDLYRAKDAAVYAQRSWNRMISDSALDYADVEEGDTGDKWARLKELAPFAVAGVIVLGGILLAIMTSD